MPFLFFAWTCITSTRPSEISAMLFSRSVLSVNDSLELLGFPSVYASDNVHQVVVPCIKRSFYCVSVRAFFFLRNEAFCCFAVWLEFCADWFRLYEKLPISATWPKSLRSSHAVSRCRNRREWIAFYISHNRKCVPIRTTFPQSLTERQYSAIGLIIL